MRPSRPALLLAGVAAVLAAPLLAWVALAASSSNPVTTVRAGGPSGVASPSASAGVPSAAPTPSAEPVTSSPPADPLAASALPATPSPAVVPSATVTASPPPSHSPSTTPPARPSVSPRPSASPARPRPSTRPAPRPIPARSQTTVTGGWGSPAIAATMRLSTPRLSSGAAVRLTVACVPAAGCTMGGSVLHSLPGTQVTLTWAAKATATHTAWARQVTGVVR